MTFYNFDASRDMHRAISDETRKKRVAKDYAAMREHLREIQAIIQYWERNTTLDAAAEDLEQAIVYWAYRNGIVKLDPGLLLDKLTDEH
jgi:hypothetical protein